MATWTLIREPAGRPAPTRRGAPDRMFSCQRETCGRTATYISAEVSRSLPTTRLCGPHMAGFKRSCAAAGDTLNVLARDAPELAAFARANATRDRELHNEMVRRLGYG